MLNKSDYLILASAIISMIFSIYLWFTGNKDAGVFVGIWVPSLLCLGSYLKASFGRSQNG
ncbi:MAG: hypothetical protein R3224_10950 [Balneolaceae bacterium]|nr:hypothetical protein [Balneolaceae bacterium]